MKKFLIIIGTILVVYVSFLLAIVAQRSKIERLQHDNYNLSVALDTLRHEKFNDSLNYATSEAYHAKDIYELRKMLTEQEAAAVKSIGVNRKDVKTLCVTSSRSVMDIPLPVHDTISHFDTIRLPSDFRYSDQWTDVAFHDSVLSISTRDSLLTVCSAVYRHRFLWWRWGLKGYKVSLVNFNPHATITYNKFVVQE